MEIASNQIINIYEIGKRKSSCSMLMGKMVSTTWNFAGKM